MTDGTSPDPAGRREAALRYRATGWAVLRAVASIAVVVALATHSASNFGEHLTHTDALYFTVTVFSTVGFGDITAKTETARLVVTGQMITDLVVLGLGIRIVLGAVSRGQRRQRQQRQDARSAQPG